MLLQAVIVPWKPSLPGLCGGTCEAPPSVGSGEIPLQAGDASPLVAEVVVVGRQLPAEVLLAEAAASAHLRGGLALLLITHQTITWNKPQIPNTSVRALVSPLYSYFMWWSKGHFPSFSCFRNSLELLQSAALPPHWVELLFKNDARSSTPLPM